MENFYITDEGNLTVRPAAKTIFRPENVLDNIIGAWSGFLGDTEYLVVALANQNYSINGGAIKIFEPSGGSISLIQTVNVPAGYKPSRSLFFPFQGCLYFLTDQNYWKLTKGSTFSLEEVAGYVPLVIINASPKGGGTTFENINRLTGYRRIQYDGDETKDYVLPEEANSVLSVTVDGVVKSAAGTFNASTHTFTFKEAPSKGINNVEFKYSTEGSLANNNREKVLSMRFAEAYNGPTDTRIFLYGDGSNVCIYSGVTEAGTPSAEYFPELFEIRVDANDSPITGMVRYQSKLIAFKPDGAFIIDYDTISLPDGSSIPAFYTRTLNRNIGNQAFGQVQSVLNYPRTIANGAVYDWKLSSYYQDERSAKIVSESVRKTLQNAAPGKIVAYDDNVKQDYYLFLNDEAGTVLVHRYLLDAWCLYKGNSFSNVTNAGKLGDTMWFFSGVNTIQCFSDDMYDIVSDSYKTAIPAVWESGYMDFNSDYMRKNSGYIWFSLFPETHSRMNVTVSTDRRDSYMEKTIGANYMGYGSVSYDFWAYSSSQRPRSIRVKLKVKKYVWHKLVISVTDPGARITIIGYDMDMQLSSRAK